MQFLENYYSKLDFNKILMKYLKEFFKWTVIFDSLYLWIHCQNLNQNGIMLNIQVAIKTEYVFSPKVKFPYY